MKTESNHESGGGEMDREYQYTSNKFRFSGPDTLYPRMQRTNKFDFWLPFNHHLVLIFLVVSLYFLKVRRDISEKMSKNQMKEIEKENDFESYRLIILMSL